MKLFHVSEEKNITEFVPKYSQHIQNSVVWAIAESKLANYLLPRNCPRVCFSAGNKTSEVERRHFLGSSEQVVAIEASWYEKAITTTLYLYQMPDIGFELCDAFARYYVADTAVVPIRQHILHQPIEEISSRNTELRLVPSLWQLHDAVVNSTLDFSIIRMKNARSRPLPPQIN